MCLVVGLINSCSSRKIGVSLTDEFDALSEFLFILALLRGVLYKHARCGSLGLACLSDLGSALHVNVGNILLLTENRQVRENIDR